MNPLSHISTADAALVIGFFLVAFVLALIVLVILTVSGFRLLQRTRTHHRRSDPHLRQLWSGTRSMHKTSRPHR